ncbi:aldehyde dehydrogenase family protein [Paracoccus cavernae]|uniref:Aldehyde dehydrogenase family protein n=1 Tax=Paracoccus cavernae TaxID=1571207 RepID=A0ABT8DBW3_9RHOB|nr:aldehyde dehydrogenase family protein [Paracoccus cavernae]
MNQQYIAGEWRPGSSGREVADLNPFDATELGVFKLASRADVDAAYKAAQAAQVAWAARPPAEREAIIRRAVAVFDARADEIRDWLGRDRARP